MSINHFSTELPEAQWWSHYKMDHIHSHSPPPANTSSPIYHNNNNNNNSTTASSSSSSSSAFCLSPHTLYRAAAPMFCSNQSAAIDLNNEDDEEFADESEQAMEMAKERLFEKPLTPSDVGKLNRLVIPKQHAEKHFPLNGTADSGENGLLLGFEDELGKSWRFRYSYWNSSQSYVLTKGWSRFVKEKRLDAGDVVVFARHPVDTGRLFIGWRRRAAQDAAQPAASGGAWNRVIYPGRPYPVPVQQQPPPSSPHFQSDSAHAASVGGGGGYNRNQKPTSSAGSGNSKTLRLFGVNLECQPDESDPLGSPMSGTGQDQDQGHPYLHQYHQYYSNNHMDISFSGADVYRQG